MESVGHARPRIGDRHRSRSRGAVLVVGLAVALLASGCVAPGAGSAGSHGGRGSEPGDIGSAAGAGTRADAPDRTGLAGPSGPTLGLARPDVTPPGLAGVTWTVPGRDGRSVVGIVGSRGRLTLPSGEVALAVDEAAVATVQSAAGTNETRVRIRSAREGGPPVEVVRPEEVDSAAFAPGHLLLSGHDGTALGRDPGVVAISLADGSVASLIPASAGPDQAAAYVRTVRVSPSGETAASGLCTQDGCALDAIDLRSGALRHLVPASPDVPGVLTDRVLLVGDPDSSGIAGIDLATGARLWERRGAEFQYAYATGDGHVVLSYIDHAGPYEFVVAVLDPLTGTERVVLRRDVAVGLTLWPELSTDAIAVIGLGGRFADLAADGGVVHAAALDLATGELEPDAVRIQVAP